MKTYTVSAQETWLWSIWSSKLPCDDTYFTHREMEVLEMLDTAKKQPKWTEFKSRLQSASEWVEVMQSCLTPCNRGTNYTVHGILQAVILEWVAILSSRGSSQPRDGIQVFDNPGLYQLSHKGRTHSGYQSFFRAASSFVDFPPDVAKNYTLSPVPQTVLQFLCILTSFRRTSTWMILE